MTRKRDQRTIMRELAHNRIVILCSVWVLALLISLPVFFHWAAPAPHTGPDKYVRLFVAYLVIAALAYWMYCVETQHLPRIRAFATIFLVLLLSNIVTNLHETNIDHGVSYFPPVQNWQWQADLENRVINLNPENLPHSYRFLPNAFVRWLQLGRLDFDQAQDIYRLLFNFLLFYALYRYARLYTTYLGAIIALLLVAAICPVSFEMYAGQLTDPMSHLSFVLALILLEKGDFALFLSALLIGSLAKETVLALGGYYVLFCRKDKNYWPKALILSFSTLIAYFGVRLFVLKGTMGYKQVSGVRADHIWTNLADTRWITVFLLTAAALVPIAAMGWRNAPQVLKRQSIYLLVVLFISSLVFSWLVESRNFMPLVFVLAVIAGRTLVGQRDITDTAEITLRHDADAIMLKR
jgi:hypothetical protein